MRTELIDNKIKIYYKYGCIIRNLENKLICANPGSCPNHFFPDINVEGKIRF